MWFLVILACHRNAPPSTDAQDAVLVERACAAAPCSGPFAQVIVWRDASGQVALVEHRGDLDACSHPPTVWLEPAAMATRLAQEERPVSPEEAARSRAEREALVDGLTHTAAVGCPVP